MTYSKTHSLVVLLLLLSLTLSAKTAVNVQVENTTNLERTIETIEIEWSLLSSKGFKANNVIVKNQDDEEVISQLLYNSHGSVTHFIFQCRLDAKESQRFTITKGKRADYDSKIFAAVYPQRFNDFAWENDIMAYRIYQEALMPTDGPSGGIDVWSKKTRQLVVDKWYAGEDYHNDHGEGCDSYKVGPTMGAGGISLLENNKLCLHANYTKVNIIAQGPIRLIAEIDFQDQKINGESVSMSKRLSLDAGSSLNKFEITYESKLDPIPLVCGILKREGAGQICMDEKEGVISYWEPEMPPYGHKGLGLVMTDKAKMGTLENHIVAYGKAESGKAFSYYSGSCWDKAGIFNTPSEWASYLKQFKQQLENPLKITVD